MAVMQRTVLVVDDDPHIRDLLTFALGKAGLATREAGDGEAALAASMSPDRSPLGAGPLARSPSGLADSAVLVATQRMSN